MLDKIGVASVDDLFNCVPQESIQQATETLAPPMPENVLSAYMMALANQNLDATKATCFIGAGCYLHSVPAFVDHVVQRSEYLTAYTPYQPEVSQGTLSIMFEFQSIICLLTGMDVANGSMYDGSTAVAEAALMASRITGRSKFYWFNKNHPHYAAVALSSGMEAASAMSDDVACVIVQYPDFYGEIPDLSAARALADKHGALLVVSINEIVALGLLPPPSEADIVIGEARSLGVAMNFGGPHVGFFACKDKHLRQLPGRICGETVDAEGNRAFALTICAREQHIKRERATSNICTNQFLLALAFTAHVSLLGEIGLKHLARLNHERCALFVDLVAKVPGVKVKNKTFFNEVTLQLPFNAQKFVDAMVAHNILAGYAVGAKELLVAVTEMIPVGEIERFVGLIRAFS